MDTDADDGKGDDREVRLDDGRRGATELNFLTSTENNGHAAIYSILNVRLSGMQVLTVKILVPSGVGPSDYQQCVRTGGETVELTFFWHVTMTDTPIIHRVCKNDRGSFITADVPSKSIGFDVFLKYLRPSITEKLSQRHPSENIMSPKQINQ